MTREAGIVPAAFYRHFESMEALGLVLIDESFRTLRDMLRGARAGKLDPNRVIESSVEILVASVAERASTGGSSAGNAPAACRCCATRSAPRSG